MRFEKKNAMIKLAYLGETPGLGVMGDKSCIGFESLSRIMDGHLDFSP